MARRVRYYGFKPVSIRMPSQMQDAWILEAVMSEGAAQQIDMSRDKEYIVERCATLNRKLATA